MNPQISVTMDKFSVTDSSGEGSLGERNCYHRTAVAYDRINIRSILNE